MRIPHALRMLTVFALISGTGLVALVPTANAHWIHDGCEETTLWADAWADQMTSEPAVAIEKRTTVLGVEYYIVHWQGGDPFSAIICLEGDTPLSKLPLHPPDIRDLPI